MRNEQTTLEQMVGSGEQLILMRDDGSETAIQANSTVDYDGWWGQFRGPWLESEKMTEDEIMARTDEAWECGDYKEMINLMAEMICRLQS